GADLMLQLSLKPAFGKPELTRIRDAVASQISPAGHFYIYGEPGRLSAPIIYIAQRKMFTEAEWTAWITQVTSPAPLASWGDAFTHNADIARAQNVAGFMQALYINARLDSSADDDVLIPGAEAALQSLPYARSFARSNRTCPDNVSATPTSAATPQVRPSNRADISNAKGGVSAEMYEAVA